MQTRLYKALEFLLLFVLYPVSLAVPYSVWVKVAIGLIGFIYVIWVLVRIEKVSLRIKKQLPWRIFWRYVLLTFIGIALITGGYVAVVAPEHLFYVPMHKPGMFAAIFVVYGLVSVWPQEVIFRTFFFQRYASLFSNQKLQIFVNAILFSLAHLFFRNVLVIVITFIGGLLFARTYLKYKSTTLVSLEHALYGNWLFAVGMGAMLGFPT